MTKKFEVTKEMKREYNKRYYEKKSNELKLKRSLRKKQYSDEKLLKIIEDVGVTRLLKLMI